MTTHIMQRQLLQAPMHHWQLICKQQHMYALQRGTMHWLPDLCSHSCIPAGPCLTILWCHVARGATEGVGAPSGINLLGKPKVAQLGKALHDTSSTRHAGKVEWPVRATQHA